MTRIRKFSVSALFVLAMLVAGCSTPDEPVDVHDPYEAGNRKVHAFNVGLDRVVVRPSANAYGFVLPAPVRRGVSNLSDYLNTPRYALNDVAQGNIGDAGHNFARFVVNTIFGFGVLDVATEAGLEKRPTGFGETLHVWGVAEGAYIVLPVFGSSTERDSVGLLVDFFTSPVSYAIDEGNWISPTAVVGDRLNQRYEFRGTIDALLDGSADSYATLRSLYLQNRRFELGQEDEFSDDLYDELFDQ